MPVEFPVAENFTPSKIRVLLPKDLLAEGLIYELAEKNGHESGCREAEKSMGMRGRGG